MSKPITFEALAALAARAGLPANSLIALGEPAVRILPSARPDELGASRLGGLPDLPGHVQWPCCERHGVSTPLSFVAQLRLRELVGLPHGLPLPEQGMLYFFVALDPQPSGESLADRGRFRVLFDSSHGPLALREPPLELAPEHVLDGVHVEFHQCFSLPTALDTSDAALERAYDSFRDRVYQLDEGPIHQVGGLPEQVQVDLRQSCEMVTAGFSPERARGLDVSEREQLAQRARHWKLLLQIGSDDERGWMWGDAGNLSFWMRDVDIARGAWEEAWIALQSS